MDQNTLYAKINDFVRHNGRGSLNAANDVLEDILRDLVHLLFAGNATTPVAEPTIPEGDQTVSKSDEPVAVALDGGALQVEVAPKRKPRKKD